jgi:hypothetical protein
MREYDGDRREPTDQSGPGRTCSDIAEIISQVLVEEPFSSPQHIAAQLRTSRALVKRTLTEVMGMKKIQSAMGSLCPDGG